MTEIVAERRFLKLQGVDDQGRRKDRRDRET